MSSEVQNLRSKMLISLHGKRCNLKKFSFFNHVRANRARFSLLDRKMYKAIWDEKIFDSKFRGGTKTFSDELIEAAVETKGKILKRVLPMRLGLDMRSMIFTKCHKLFWIIDEKIQEFVTGGLIEHYNKEFYEALDPKRYDHLYAKGPKVLTLDHLEAGFVIWLVSICFTIVVFACEWLNRVKDYLIVRAVISKCFELKMSEIKRIHDKRIEKVRFIDFKL